MKYKIYIHLFFLSFVLLIEPNSSMLGQIKEKQFHTVSEGLSQNTVTSIVQDELGFLWVGTRYGLNKYNGVEFENFEYQPNSKSAITNNFINCLLADQNGKIWVGTYGDGINVYDIHNDDFEYFSTNQKPENTLSDDYITAIYQDPNNLIWIGTEKGGLNIYDPKTQSIDRSLAYNKKTMGLPQYISAISADKMGNMWLGTWSEGLYVVEAKTATITAFNTNKTTNSNDKNNDNYSSSSDQKFNEGAIRCLHYAPASGRLWMGLDNGIKEIVSNGSTNNAQFSFKKFETNNSNQQSIQQKELIAKLNSSVVLSIYESPENKLWIGTENNGLFEIDLDNNHVSLYTKDALTANGLRSNSIWSLFGDTNGTLWIGTYLQGLNKLDPLEQKFEKVSQLLIQNEGQRYEQSLGLVSAFTEDKEGGIWFGTDGDGLVFFDKSQNKYVLFNKKTNPALNSNEVTSLLFDKQENLWVGTWNGGINILKKGATQFEQIVQSTSSASQSTSLTFPSPQFISGNDIHSLLEDKKGRIWIAAYRSGLDVYNPQTEQFYHFNQMDENSKRKIESVKIRALAEDNKGNIWIGTEESGLQRITLNDNLEIIEVKSFFNKKEGQEAYSINTLTKDSRGNIWVGTEGNGLYKYNALAEIFEEFTKKDGLPSDMIYAILEDDKGSFWISTNKGIFSFTPSKPNTLDSGQSNDSTIQDITTYSTADGLQSNEFYKSSCLKTKDGLLYFGGINGFNTFRPEKIINNKKAPKVYITDFKVSNKSYTNTEKFKQDEQNQNDTNFSNSNSIFNDQHLYLKHSENDLALEFTALNFTQSSKNQYQYQLENYDNNWRKSGIDKIAYYPNVPPGKYTFRVKASNNDGVWNETGAVLHLSIAKPWYATWLAYFIYAASILGLLIWARNNIISKERLKGQLNLERMELNKMQEVDELKSQFFANISHEFKTPLTLIISPLQSLIKNTKESDSIDENGQGSKYNIMLKNAERLYRLINQILDLSKIESGSAELKASENDIVGFLKYIAINFATYAEEEYINYKLDLPSSDIPIYFDKHKMEKVFVNLLSNAFKYTQRYGAISVVLKDTEQAIEISIIDSGKGIDMEEQNLIFERYYQTKNNTSFASTGIGLSLTKQIVEMHKGTIVVDSKLGIGTTFTVTLPKGKTHLKKTNLVNNPSDFVYSEESLIKMSEFAGSGLNVTEDVDKETKTQDEKPIVLIAEDNDDMRLFIADSLADKYQVLQAENGLKAYEMAKEHIPDLVITDVMMPEMDGFELSHSLKTNILTSHIFVIMLTVKSAEESHEKGFEAGVDNYLTKPFNMSLLEMRVQNLLQSRKRFKEQIQITGVSNSGKVLNIEPSKLPSANLDEAFLKDFVSVIEQNISNPNFNIDNICKELGFSKSQFYRKTKSLLGQTPNAFIKTIKLKRAAQLLRDGSYKISEVTYKVGFNDLKYFRTSFKKQYGMTPSEFSKQHKENSLEKSK